MVFVFAEDGTVEVIDSKELASQYEAGDVESGVFVFYDEDGTWLQPNFTKPNRFELVRNAQPDSTIDPFDVAIKEAVALEPNPHFKSLDEIASYVAARRSFGNKDSV